jgi:putative transposase
VDTYHQRVHPETGQTPVARWAAGNWLPRMPDSLEALDLLLLTVATPRKVQRDGIHCHGLRYFSLTLAAYIGEPVTVRYDPRDLAEIRASNGRHGGSPASRSPNSTEPPRATLRAG